jgi:hypothetical protein
MAFQERVDVLAIQEDQCYFSPVRVSWGLLAKSHASQIGSVTNNLVRSYLHDFRSQSAKKFMQICRFCTKCQKADSHIT